MKSIKLFLSIILAAAFAVVLPSAAQAQRKAPAKKAPAKNQVIVPIWTGTVKAVRTKEEKQGVPGMSQNVSVYKTLSENYTLSATLTGERDTTGGIVNNFIGAGKAEFTSREYREENIPTRQMSCDNRIIESAETQKIEIIQQASKSDRILVSVSTNGGELGIISFTPPQLESERVIARTYTSGCASYDKTNTNTEKSQYPTEVIQPDFYVEFELKGDWNKELHGSKTVTQSDGSKTTYSWDLTRNN